MTNEDYEDMSFIRANSRRIGKLMLQEEADYDGQNCLYRCECGVEIVRQRCYMTTEAETTCGDCNGQFKEIREVD